MSLASLRASFLRNRPALALLGAVAVAGLALVARKRGTAGAAVTTSTATGSGGITPSSPFGASAQTYALAPYDSSASDVYNALQPQIEELLNRIPVDGKLTEPSPAPTPTPTPTPTPAPKPAPTFMGLVQRAGSPDIFERRSDGTLRHISYAEWSGANFPGFATVAANDPLWGSPVVS